MDVMKLAPYAAGSPPAVVLGITLYNSVITAASPALWPLAALVAVCGVAGMMTAEIYTYRKAAEAFAMREVGAFWLMLAGGLVCSGLIIYAIYTGANARSLVSSTIVTVIFYVALAADAYLKSKDTKIKNDTARIKAEASKLRAEASVIKASSGQAQVSSGQTGQAGRRYSSEMIARVITVMQENPGCSARFIAEKLNCSPQTASDYKKYLESK